MRDPAEEARRNYGFVRTEILPGNIGYIRFDAFSASEEARGAAAAAMAFVSHCDAIVFDLRQNGGGSPRMVEFLGGYLFESPTVLNAFFDRKGKRVSQTKTLETVPGPKVTVPVYLLTAARTFSCAEEFSYDLKSTKRATIVGETTGGGAHPVKGVPLNDRFEIMVPYERAENPVTHDNWEGKGVEPDIKAPADQALEAALADFAKRRQTR
jgi:C-terminal processing protease CtpA/Prc